MTNLNILIANDGYHAHYFERLAWLNAFNSVPGINAHMYNCKEETTFDVFTKFNPDIFIGQLYNLDSATTKCIIERPHLKVALRAGDWGDFNPDCKFILRTTEKEIEALENLKKKSGQPEFLFIHYLQEDIANTHNYFKDKLGIDVKSIMLCADVHSYINSEYDERLACDIGFVGGYWPYKGYVIDQYLTPLCFPVGKYNIKIFGNQPWKHVNQYCGTINDNHVKNLFKSAAICPNLSEPHAHQYGIEINERSFKILCAGGFCISDNVLSHKKIFQDGVVFADSPKDFEDKINYYLQNPDERLQIISAGRNLVLNNHTNFHRIASFLLHFGYDQLSRTALNTWSQINER
jgi:hypothetical protein